MKEAVLKVWGFIPGPVKLLLLVGALISTTKLALPWGKALPLRKFPLNWVSAPTDAVYGLLGLALMVTDSLVDSVSGMDSPLDRVADRMASL